MSRGNKPHRERNKAKSTFGGSNVGKKCRKIIITWQHITLFIQNLNHVWIKKFQKFINGVERLLGSTE